MATTAAANRQSRSASAAAASSSPVTLPSSLSPNRVFLSPIPTTAKYSSSTAPQQVEHNNNSIYEARGFSSFATAHNQRKTSTTNAAGSGVIINTTPRQTEDTEEEFLLYYYSRISSTVDEEDDEDDSSTILTEEAKDDDYDRYTAFSMSPPRSLDTALSPTTTTTTTTTKSITSEEKLLPASPPLSPPLSPTMTGNNNNNSNTSSGRPRFPRWIKQISTPNIITTTNAMSHHDNSGNGIWSPPSTREPSMTSKSSSSTLLPKKPHSLMRRMLMPPTTPPLQISHPAVTAHYYGSMHVRKYLHEAMKPNRFDEMLLSGFSAMCPLHSRKNSSNNPASTAADDVFDDSQYLQHAYHRNNNSNDDYSTMTSITDDVTEESCDDEDEEDNEIIISHPCLCNHRQMTIRITLTPAHCRATETEIYGQSRPSHHQQRSPIQQLQQHCSSKKRLMGTSISTPTRAATMATKSRHHPKEPIPTLSLPPLPRHYSSDSGSCFQPQQRTSPPIYAVTSSQPPHIVHQSPVVVSTNNKSTFRCNNSYHQTPIVVLPNGTRRHYLQK
ncbi:hypothetical protein BDB00DRAFT_869013 [Zychaea mexicana]|uniref:uncharacterized protein n=1 Tax=Zychaea mexicana TaxID=64656 RepID=UPI0022FF060D|nr:uncharacterized protein BDB00DRAFT_869013 [Zychaea mexicana]KAI9496787.1 hypothetical protein BDB00DRAFT_869013 [Zychaea mexicana]